MGHPCRRAHDALDEAGVDYDTIIADRNRPFGLFTSGKRPELKAPHGQEKLPVLVAPGGEIVAGSGEIVDWAKLKDPG